MGMVSWVGATSDGNAASFAPIVVESASSATLPEVMAQLAAERLVYVGETHTTQEDHLIQLAVLRAMAARPKGLAVGIEWIQARFQPVVDRYLAGEIDEAQFLRDTEYYDRWRFDYRFYRPILEFAKANGIPVIALNASKELTDQVRKSGLNDLPQQFKTELPDAYDFDDKAYEESLREMFRLHSREDADFQRFLEVQLTWDESMAQRVAEYLDRNPKGRMLVLAGKGHIAGRAGIPNRVTRRTGLKGVTIGSFKPASRSFDRADYLVLAREHSLPAPGLMRVFLDENDDGVIVRDFSPESPAEAAGIAKNDRLVEIDGRPVRFFADVKINLIDRAPGDEIVVKAVRTTPLIGDEVVWARFRLAGEARHH